jgi:DNA helicase-2/ATP-dependent DNA helicase PcrA
MQSAREQYQRQFTELIDRLNEAQRTAVEHIEGPVLVIAGPGAGKTQLLSARVGNILLKTDASPANILCLTFTDAGVLAMRNRLLSFIGPEAHRVHIYTFHSFCNSIIQNNLEIFGRQGLEPLSDLERVELIRRLIDALPAHHPLRLGKTDPYFYERHLRELFQNVKAENWTPAYVNTQIDAYLEDLPNRQNYRYQVNRGLIRKGDLKEAQLQAETERMERLRAAVKLYPRYLDALRRAHRYDYEDMLLWVLRAFEEHPSLLRSYQEQYLYLLVDEYQDTNGAQNTILQKLIDYWDKPNIFIVGDDDQSIYEFQGARLKNLSDFYRKYEPDQLLVLLEQNYRSSQPILDAANVLIQYNEKRIVHELSELAIEKTLLAVHADWGHSEKRPQLVEYITPLEEIVDVLQQIEQLRAEGVPLTEIAVIYAKHRQAAVLIDLLEKKGIPYEAKRKINVLDLPLIVMLREVLVYLLKESEAPYSAEHLLFRILHFPFLNIDPQDLAAVSLRQARNEGERRLHWRALLADRKLMGSLNLKQPDKLLAWGQLINEWLNDLHELPLIKLLERIINRSGLLHYALERAEADLQISALSSFFDFLRREVQRRPRLQLAAWLEMLHKMDANRLAIELQLTNPGVEAVQLVTAHSAKGLEFEYVFMIDCLKDHWEPNTRGSRYRFALPDTLTLSGEEDALEARRRLFYVAMTRAKHTLQFSYARVDAQGKEQSRTQFLDELLSHEAVDFTQKQISGKVMLEARRLQLQENKPAPNNHPPAGALDVLLNQFTMSISALNQYLRCPLAFYYEKILRAPVAWSEAAGYGAAVHNTLQRVFELMLQSKKKVFPSLNTCLKIFAAELEHFRAYFSEQAFIQRKAEGERKLGAFYQYYKTQWHKNVKLEFMVRNVEIDGVPVTGVIDKLEFHKDQAVFIVDYKTGALDGKRLQGPSEKQPYGGSYWRQLIFYKLLYEAYDRSGYQVKKGVIAYLEPNRSGQYPEKHLSYHSEEVDLVRSLIRETYARIRRHEFFAGCGEPNCEWCRFAQLQAAPDSFAGPETEELDD